MSVLDNYLHHKYQKRTPKPKIKKPTPTTEFEVFTPNPTVTQSAGYFTTSNGYIGSMPQDIKLSDSIQVGKSSYQTYKETVAAIQAATIGNPVIDPNNSFDLDEEVDLQPEPVDNEEVSKLLTGMSQKSLLEILKMQWKHLNNATFAHILEIIGYPQPFPNLKNVTQITYNDNILEIIEGEEPNEVDEYNVPRHGIHKSRPKASKPPEYPGQKPSRGNADPNKPRWYTRTAKKLEKELSSGPQHKDRSLDPF